MPLLRRDSEMSEMSRISDRFRNVSLSSWVNVVNTHIPDFGQPEFVDELVSLVGLAEYTLEILPHLQQNLDPHADLLEERGVRTVALDRLEWKVIRVTAKRLRSEPFAVVEEVWDALRARGFYFC